MKLVESDETELIYKLQNRPTLEGFEPHVNFDRPDFKTRL